MEENDIKERIDVIEKELTRVKNLYEKALFYKTIDPEVSLGQARKSAEVVCKQIYITEGFDINDKPVNKMMLNDLIQFLSQKNILPKAMIISLRAIQDFGNFGVHDQGEDSLFIDESYIKPCLNALSNLVNWYFNVYIKNKNLGSYTFPVIETNITKNDNACSNTHHHTIEKIYKFSGIQIRDIFKFFKDTISVFSKSGSKFRLHYLKYDKNSDLLSMYVQDQTYEDKDFEIDLKEGLSKEIIVCEAIDKKKLVYRDLKDGHYTVYSDSSIPEKLASVMAFPICNGKKQIVGVVSLDSKKKFSELTIDIEDLEDLFIKLCFIIENIIINIEGIYE